MGILDEIETRGHEEQEQQSLSQLTSMLDAQRRQLETLTGAVSKLTSYVGVVDEETSERLDRLLAQTQTSPQRAQPSPSTGDDGRLTEIVKLQKQIADAVAVEHYSTVLTELQAVAKRVTAITTLAAKQAAARDAEMTKRLGEGDALVRHAVGAVKSVAASAPEAAAEAVTHRIDESNARAQRVLDTTAGLESRIGWIAVGRMALALIPVAVVVLVAGALLGVIGQAFGVGPLAAWAWESFVAAPEWWQKLLVAVAAIGASVGGIWTLSRAAAQFADWLDGHVRSWGR
ncbi:hypothetical protein [Demequina sp.]|uniref:hypothetical protein n=1 Tax=Demequina sp. TaxID=2050685 RepID=UPI003A89E12C